MDSDYTRVGGTPALVAVVDDFYRRVVADPRLAGYFTGVDMPTLRRHQTLMLTRVLGGPDAYHGRPLGEAHAGLGVDDADFDRVVGHLTAALVDAGVPGDVLGRVSEVLEAARAEVVTGGH